MWLLKKFCPDFSEASTYRGLLALLGLFGVHVAPEFTPYIIMGGVLVYGLLHVFLPDRFKKAPDFAAMEQVVAQLTATQQSTTPPPAQSIPAPTGPAPASRTVGVTAESKTVSPGSPSGGPFGTS